MFLSWGYGASLHSVPPQGYRTVAKFIVDMELTSWMSVPSMTAYMIETDTIRPGSLPLLKRALFGGEAVSYKFARLWQLAANNAEIAISYGPTESTVACTYYRMPTNAGEEIAVNGVMPIGFPTGNTPIKVVDVDGKAVAQGEQGELWVGGELVTAGYLKDEEKTKERFIESSEPGEGVWYRTGDRVFRSEDGRVNFLGRVDDQVKIHGYRVELSEIEVVVKKLAECHEAAAIPWPLQDGIAVGVHVFVVRSEDQGPNLREIVRGCRQLMPTYMVPKRVHFLDSMPLTATGKTDRKQLVELLEKGVE